MTDVTVTIPRVLRQIAVAAEACGRNPAEIHLVAVSKRHPAALVEQALATGQRDFGENYVREAQEKIASVKSPGAIWHFIGQLQANKTRTVATLFDWVHTVDRARIARRLSEQRPENLPPLNVCVQVRLDNDDARGGVELHELASLADLTAGLPRLRLRGLMCLPPTSLDDSGLKTAFRCVADAQADLNRHGHALTVLSMGMSDDLEAAISQGATHVRVGTAIFGARPAD